MEPVLNLLRGLEAADLEWLLGEGKELELVRGSCLIRANDRLDGLYAVLQGMLGTDVRHHVLDWRLIHRTEADMQRLFEESAFARSCTRIQFEACGVNLFAECVRS
jgi:hypothetical protein